MPVLIREHPINYTVFHCGEEEWTDWGGR